MANREIDNNTSKYRYRNTMLDGKKSTKDEYTGERIFIDQSHSMRKRANVDHVTPIAVIKERYKDLSVEQLRELANSKSNYAVTNARLNSIGKGALENHEYLGQKTRNMTNSLFAGKYKEANKEMLELKAQAPRMLSKEIKSRTCMEIKATGFRVENTINAVSGHSKDIGIVGMEFIEDAGETISNSAFPFMVLGVQNIFEVASGQKTFEEAEKEMKISAAEIVLTDGGVKIVKKAVLEAGERLGSNFIKKLVANSNEISQVIAIGNLVFQSFVKLVNDEISGTEFFDEIGEKGVSLAGDLIGSIVGGGIANALLPATMAAGPAGIIIGASVIVGSMVMSTICTGIYRYTQNLRDNCLAKENDYRNKLARINHIADMAILEIQFQQQELKRMIDDQSAKWAESFDVGFRNMLESMLNNDFEQMSDGINHILNVFGEAVLFKNMDEFDSFFFDDNAVLNL